ncbi:MAG: HK97 family phage prohead protease [Gammaproteobacteria bacterium]|nr:HK97 family phage prohead protease [Gammaproteobacteria bacterium]
MRDYEVEYKIATDIDYDANEGVVEGVLMKYGSFAVHTFGGERFQERVEAGAFGPDVEKRKDISANMMHDSPRLLARTGTKRLSITDGNEKLTFRMTLPDTPTGQEVKTLLADGTLDGASVEIAVIDDSYDRETKTRTIREAKLLGFGLVDVPAFKESRITKRRFEDLANEAKAAGAAERSEAADVTQARLRLASTYGD